jgi:hypothetical protein
MFMKYVLSLALLIGLSFSARAQQPREAPESGVKRVTLYGPLAHGYDSGRANVSFKTGAYGQDWDLGYGSLYVSGELDWLQVSIMRGVRTALRDLGAFDWSDELTVPAVEPFPKLKEGESRQVVVNTDGADGKPGTPAPPSGPAGPPVNGEDGLRGSPISRGYFPPSGAIEPGGSPGYVEQPLLSSRRSAPPPAAPRPTTRRDGVPKIDPIFAKAIPGHMYVLRVVDDVEDFYVLFRVESLVRGDNCTIAWKRVPAPLEQQAVSK